MPAPVFTDDAPRGGRPRRFGGGFPALILRSTYCTRWVEQCHLEARVLWVGRLSVRMSACASLIATLSGVILDDLKLDIWGRECSGEKVNCAGQRISI